MGATCAVYLLLVLLIKYCAVSFFIRFSFFFPRKPQCAAERMLQRTEGEGPPYPLWMLHPEFTQNLAGEGGGGGWGLQNKIQGHTMKSRGDIEGPATFKQCNDKFSLAHTKLVHACQVKAKWGKWSSKRKRYRNWAGRWALFHSTSTSSDSSRNNSFHMLDKTWTEKQGRRRKEGKEQVP